MAVINLRSWRRQADATDAHLRGDHLVTLGFGDAVLPAKMTSRASSRLACLAAACQAIGCAVLAVPFNVGLHLAAAPAVLVAGWDGRLFAHRPPLRYLALPVVLSRALPAVRLESVTHGLVARECRTRLVLLTPRTLLDFSLVEHSRTPPPPSIRRRNGPTARPFERSFERNPQRSLPRHRRSRPEPSPRRRSASPVAP